MRRTRYILAVDFLLLVLSGLGAYRLAQKAAFPAELRSSSGILVISKLISKDSPLNVGDTVLSLNGQRVTSENEVEFLCEEYPIGTSVTAALPGKPVFPVALIRSNSFSKILIESLAAFVFFFVGIVVLLKQQEKKARIFHHLSVAIGSLILVSPGIYNSLPPWLDTLFGILFYFSYIIVPALFLHFTTIFPYQKISQLKRLLIPVYSIGFFIALWASVMLLRTVYPSVTLSNFAAYDKSNIAVLLFFIAAFFAGFGNIIHSYRTEKEEFERKKLRWILFGIIVGACAYIFFSAISRLLIHHLIFPEEYLIACSVIAPISFAIAIVRYRVFDIDLIINRSAVYTAVITLLLGVYLSVVWFFTQFYFDLRFVATMPNIIAAVLIALLFEPLRKRMQKFVDKKFYRVSYNFYEAQRSISDEIKFTSTKVSLANFLIERIDALIPVTKIGFFVVEYPNDRLRLLSHHGFAMLEGRNVPFQKRDLKTKLGMPVALRDMIEPDIAFEEADETVFRRWEIAVVLPMLSASKQILGFLVLGEKRSRVRYSLEDISLLNSLAGQSGLALDRLKIEYALMLEQAESERLAELNKLKSYFVSSVSHDLKTPLTSIRLFAEFLKEHENLPREKAMEYYGIIEGEADRLSRLITNVLDFAKIEKGKKEYSMKHCELNEIANHVMSSMTYQLSSNGFEVQTKFHEAPLAIEADADAIFDALTNLVSNAMKYSPPDRKQFAVTTKRADGYAILSVEDNGYGIADRETGHIFDSFYRSNDPRMRSAGGAGLGLSIVKHTMDAHGGKIEVKSEIGKGSSFALYFPLEKK